VGRIALSNRAATGFGVNVGTAVGPLRLLESGAVREFGYEGAVVGVRSALDVPLVARLGPRAILSPAGGPISHLAVYHSGSSVKLVLGLDAGVLESLAEETEVAIENGLDDVAAVSWKGGEAQDRTPKNLATRSRLLACGGSSRGHFLMT
jgi:hypothetical protein